VPATLCCPCLSYLCSFTANICTCNKRLALIAAVLQLQLDPGAEVFSVDGIQLFSGKPGDLKTLGGRSWSNRCGGVPDGVRGEHQSLNQVGLSLCLSVRQNVW
jgi:hypothetical protein